MSDRIRVAVSGTPIVTASGSDFDSHDVHYDDVDTFGGSGDVEVAYGTDNQNGGSYKQASTGSSGSVVASGHNYQFLAIKHTGHKWDSLSELGDTIDAEVEVFRGSGGSYHSLGRIGPGGMMIFSKLDLSTSGENITCKSLDGGDSIAIEYWANY